MRLSTRAISNDPITLQLSEVNRMWHVAHTLSNRFEADLIMDALEREGIPAVLRTFEETPYDGLFIPQRGWGRVLVAKVDVSKAKAVIALLMEDLESRQLYQNPDEVDPLLWEQLETSNSDEICRRAQVRYDPERSGYVLPFLSGTLCCIPSQQRMEFLEAPASDKVDFQLGMVILHYLLEAKSTPLAGTWVGEKDIPGGSFFFAGPHAFPTDGLLELFGARIDLFRAAMEALGGSPVDMGDAAYRIWALPRVPLLFILWQGDDEFKPALHIRFDGSIQDHLEALDTIWGMVNVVCRNIAVAAKNLSANGEEL